MICPYCKSDIDDDSFFCDQCGKEILVCSQCGRAGKGRNCVEDGAKLISRQQQASGGVPKKTSQPAKPISLFDMPAAPPPAKVSAPKSTFTPPQNTAPIPELRLVNPNIDVDITLQNNDIVGRAAGNHVDIFGKYSQVSSQHAQFIYQNNEWVVKDLNSTNGTAVNAAPNWQDVPKLPPQLQRAIHDGEYLLIANIEFQIKIGASPSPQVTPTGTQRL